MEKNEVCNICGERYKPRQGLKRHVEANMRGLFTSALNGRENSAEKMVFRCHIMGRQL